MNIEDQEKLAEAYKKMIRKVHAEKGYYQTHLYQFYPKE